MNPKVIPHDIESEKSVIGSMFISRDAMNKACDFLTSDMFFNDAHAKIFDVMKSLVSKHIPIDLTTIIAEMNNKKILGSIGGVEYLSYVINYVPNASHIETYIKNVSEKALLRNLIDKCTDLIDLCYKEDIEVGAIIESTEKTILEVVKNRRTSEIKNIREILNEAHSNLEQLSLLDTDITGLSTGFRDLDKLTAGLHPSQFIIIAARPAVGKTAFALNLLVNAAKTTKKAVVLFNLEMSAVQLAYRMLSSEGEIESTKLSTGKLEKNDWNKLGEAIKNLADTNIYIDDTAGITAAEIRSKARRLAMNEEGLGLIVIDYLQLISGPLKSNGNRQQEVSEISRSLKLLALELGIPVIALSQLSRSVETRDDKRPIMSDLRESGSIEQDADIVSFLYRDDYYDSKANSNPNVTTIELIVGKHRNGATDTLEFIFRKNISSFRDKDLSVGGE